MEMNELAKELLNIPKGRPRCSISESCRIEGYKDTAFSGLLSFDTNMVYISDLIRNVCIYESFDLDRLPGFDRAQLA